MYKQLFKNSMSPSPHGKVGLYNKRNNTKKFISTRKGFSSSESYTPGRLKKTAYNVDFVLQHPGKRNNKPAAKLYTANEDLVKYLKQFEEMDTIHSHSLPLLKTTPDTSLSNELLESPKNKLFQTFPKESYYQTCYISKDDNFVVEEQQQEMWVWPSYFHFTLESPVNSAKEQWSSTPKTFSLQDTPILPPPERQFISGSSSLMNSTRKDNKSRGVSLETSSALSSETDSDFTFYPCSSHYGNSLGLETSDYTDKICELPSHLEDPDSPCPPFRHGYGETSLEDFTKQFYLEDDALSDDVFVDDWSFVRGDDTFACVGGGCFQTHSSYTPLGMSINSQFENMSINETPRTVASNRNYRMINQSSSRAVAVNQACEERSQSLTLVLSEETGNEKSKAQNKTSVRSDSVITVDLKINDPSRSSLSSERKRISESEDFDWHSEYNLNLANAFDSLRKNSMQTKSRQLWKERRTRMRRSTLFNLKTTTAGISDGINDNCSNGATDNNNNGHRKNSGSSSPCSHVDNKVSSRDVVSTIRNDTNTPANKNKNANPKPLRGILKNKNAVYHTSKTTPPTSQSNSPCINTSINRGGDGGSLYEYCDNDISSDRGNRFISVRNETQNLNSSFAENPAVTSDNNNDDDDDESINNITPFSYYSLDSRSKSQRRKRFHTSKVLSSPPPVQRRFNRASSKNKNTNTPSNVSVGIQVDMQDLF